MPRFVMEGFLVDFSGIGSGGSFEHIRNMMRRPLDMGLRTVTEENNQESTVKVDDAAH